MLLKKDTLLRSPASDFSVHPNDGVKDERVISDAGIAKDDRLLDPTSSTDSHVLGNAHIWSQLNTKFIIFN